MVSTSRKGWPILTIITDPRGGCKARGDGGRACPRCRAGGGVARGPCRCAPWCGGDAPGSISINPAARPRAASSWVNALYHCRGEPPCPVPRRSLPWLPTKAPHHGGSIREGGGPRGFYD